MASTQTNAATKKKSAPAKSQKTAPKASTTAKKVQSSAKDSTKDSTKDSAKDAQPRRKTSAAATKSAAKATSTTTKARTSKASTKTAAPEQFPVSAAHAGDSVAHGTETPEERYLRIQNTAYHIAERDGFQEGREQDYWFQAEQEVNRQS